MKSNLNIPTLKYSMPSKILPSFILYNSEDKYFGQHYVLYEHGFNYLMTKEFSQCYRVHADYLKNNTDSRIIKDILYK